MYHTDENQNTWRDTLKDSGKGQRRNEVIWRPGQDASLASPCSNMRSFGRKCMMYWKITCDILGTFRRLPQSIGAHIMIRHLEIAPPLPHRYAPARGTNQFAELNWTSLFLQRAWNIYVSCAENICLWSICYALVWNGISSTAFVIHQLGYQFGTNAFQSLSVRYFCLVATSPFSSLKNLKYFVKVIKFLCSDALASVSNARRLEKINKSQRFRLSQSICKLPLLLSKHILKVHSS